MKLVAITNSATTKFETDIINNLFEEGLDELHICKSKFEKKDYIKFLDKIKFDYHNKIVLHDCYSLVHMYDIDKIHLNRSMKNNIVKELILDHITLRGKTVTKSIRVDNCRELYKQTSGVDEIILGPIFSKSTYTLNTQLIKTDDLTRAIRHSKYPILGLGGVTAQTTEFFKNAGFGGIILQSGIWRNADPVRAFVQIRDIAHNNVAEPLLKIAI
jgi:thiamine-phosphate pyrophosphorylase